MMPKPSTGKFLVFLFLTLVVAIALTVRTTRVSAEPQSSGEPSGPRFTTHTIDTGLTDGYQVVVQDLNRDGKPDIIALASGLTELRWYQNPGWEKHVLVTGIN